MISQVQVGFYNALKLWPEAWAATTAFAVGDVIQKTTYNSHSYKCTTAGTTGAVEPTFSTTNEATTADGSVVWTCYDTKTYNIKAPQNATAPYVVFGLLTEMPTGTFADFEAIEDITFWVNCYSDKSTADVSEICDEVMDVLDDATLTVTGYTTMKCVREYIGNPVWDDETRIYMMPCRYRIWLDKS